MIYTGTIHRVRQHHAGRSYEAVCSGWRWSCSCGAEQQQDTLQPDKLKCERNLDQHLLTHNPHFIDLDAAAPEEEGVSPTHAREEGKKTDPVIAVEGAPPLIVRKDRVEVVEGSWAGKVGTVTSLPEDPKGTHVMVKFDNETGEYPVKACILTPCPPDHAREDDERVPNNVPNDDATNDVQQDVPVNEGRAEHAPPQFPCIIIDYDSLSIPSIIHLQSRWELFTDDELITIYKSLGSGMLWDRWDREERTMFEEIRVEIKRRDLDI